MMKKGMNIKEGKQEYIGGLEGKEKGGSDVIVLHFIIWKIEWSSNCLV